MPVDTIGKKITSIWSHIPPPFSSNPKTDKRKALHGLRQAPRLWYQEIRLRLVRLGRSQTRWFSSIDISGTARRRCLNDISASVFDRALRTRTFIFKITYVDGMRPFYKRDLQLDNIVSFAYVNTEDKEEQSGRNKELKGHGKNKELATSSTFNINPSPGE